MRHVEFPPALMWPLHAKRPYKDTIITLHYSKSDAAPNRLAHTPSHSLSRPCTHLLATTSAQFVVRQIVNVKASLFAAQRRRLSES